MIAVAEDEASKTSVQLFWQAAAEGRPVAAFPSPEGSLITAVGTISTAQAASLAYGADGRGRALLGLFLIHDATEHHEQTAR